MSPDHDIDTEEMPPPPPGLAPNELYLHQMHAWSTRRIERSIRVQGDRTVRALRGERDAAPSVLGRLATAITRIPTPVQLAVVATICPVVGTLLLQWSGMAFTRVTGMPPPQMPVPVSIVGEAHADDPEHP